MLGYDPDRNPGLGLGLGPGLIPSLCLGRDKLNFCLPYSNFSKKRGGEGIKI